MKIEDFKIAYQENPLREDLFTCMTSEGPPETISVGICERGQFSMLMICAKSELLPAKLFQAWKYLKIGAKGEFKGESVQVWVVIHIQWLKGLQWPNLLEARKVSLSVLFKWLLWTPSSMDIGTSGRNER